MKYYKHNAILYTSNAPISNENFVEISKDEYDLKLSKIKVEQPTPSDEDEWGICIDDATEQDYQNALEEMGVVFDD